MKEQLRPGGHVRYCDDFLLFADDMAWLGAARDRCRTALQALRLDLHATKSVVSLVADGLPFLGFRVFSDHRRLARGGAGRMRRRLADTQRDYAAGRTTLEQVRTRIHAWLGHARHGATWRLRLGHQRRAAQRVLAGQVAAPLLPLRGRAHRPHLQRPRRPPRRVRRRARLGDHGTAPREEAPHAPGRRQPELVPRAPAAAAPPGTH